MHQCINEFLDGHLAASMDFGTELCLYLYDLHLNIPCKATIWTATKIQTHALKYQPNSNVTHYN